MTKVVQEYESWLRSWGASSRTIGARTNLGGKLLALWSLEGFTTHNVETFLSNPEFSPWTRATYHSNLTCFCRWLAASGHIPENPMADVRKPRRPKGRPRPLSESEVEAVLKVASGQVRDWIMLALLAGLRVSEIAKLRGEDITPQGIYVEGKGGSVESLPCHPDLWEVAQNYPRQGYWFPGVNGGHMRSQNISLVVGRLFDSLGIAGSAHRARHTYGTRLIRSGANIRTVQKLMRHANLETTANYTAVDEDEMRNAILRLSA